MRYMKTIKYIAFIFCAGVMTSSLFSCSDFLETNPSESVSDNAVFVTTQGAQAALNGCYSHLRIRDGGGAGREDDRGISAMQMTFDVCGEDMVVWGGWYGYDASFWGHTRGDIFKTSLLWNFHYRLINNLNAIINQIDGTVGPAADKQYIKGQALALRGWAYFGLVRLFQHTYIIAKDMPGVPIYLETSSDKTEGQPRAKVVDVYSRVTEDLEAAATLLTGFTRKNITEVNKQVAQSFLAEVYLTMNVWDKAAENARAAQVGLTLMDSTRYNAGFSKSSDAEWIWGMDQTETQNMGDYSPYAMWANWSRACFSFACFFVVDDFVNLFDTADVRHQFYRPWPADHPYLYSSNKFRDKDDCRGSIVFIRAATMLLTEAEALARSNDEAGAKALLWKLQDARKAVRTTSTGAQLITDILIERRKELYGEGYAWYDLIRNQLPLVRSSHHRDVVNIPARSWRWVYQIPIGEITNNKALTAGNLPAGDQNPFDGIYTPQ